MPGLVPGIHVLRFHSEEDLDGRVKPTGVRFDFYGQGA